MRVTVDANTAYWGDITESALSLGGKELDANPGLTFEIPDSRLHDFIRDVKQCTRGLGKISI